MSKMNKTIITITRKKVEEEGILIGEGITRRVYELNGKVYKVCCNRSDCLRTFRTDDCFLETVDSNINEFNLYQKNKDKYNFLNPTLRRKNNYRIIEQEKIDCKKVWDMVLQITESWCPEEEDILELMKQGYLNEYMDFNYEEVIEFINENYLEYDEICLTKQWGISKEGYLRLCDYGR